MSDNTIRRVELDNIGFDVGNDPVTQGQVALRWRKLTYGGDKVIASEYHRDVIDVDSDLDARLEEIARDLERQGFGRPPATDRGYIDDAVKRAWTPEVRAAVAAERAAKAEREAKVKAEQKAAEQAAKDAEQKRFDDAVAAAVARQKA